MRVPIGKRSALAVAAAVGLMLSAIGATPAYSAATSPAPGVLRVGSWHGIPGTFSSIQAAVNAARPGDWILVGPGDYHESGSDDPAHPAGVMIRTPDLYLRGMDRNNVVVDGTRPGAPGPCPAGAEYQSNGPNGPDGKPAGRSGIEVYKASGVWVQNLTACNFLTSSSGGEGNQIWWNGGDGDPTIGMGSYRGDYITATSSYSNGVNPPFGDYGIFASKASGPGVIDHSYASNMGDAGYYIGGCQTNCNTIVRNARAQYNALAYSGTDSGGNLVIESSEFDHNKTGITSDSENNDDAPSPADGSCPNGAAGPLGGHSCEIWRYNYIHDNNNPNVPGNATNGLAGAAPIGTAMVLAGTRNVTQYHNTIANNGAWGTLITDQPYMGTPPPFAQCQGGVYVVPGQVCYYQAFGNQVIGNTFRNNGFFGNPTNGDLGLATLPHAPGNCFTQNTDPEGVTSDPPNLQSFPYNPCGQANGGDLGPLAAEVLCATQLLGPCPSLPGASYPRATQVVLPPLQAQPSMPNPCAGVPANPWCPRRSG
jgi:hypothetical protein